MPPCAAAPSPPRAAQVRSVVSNTVHVPKTVGIVTSGSAYPGGVDAQAPEPPLHEFLLRTRTARGWGVREAARAIGIAHSRLLDFEQGFDQHTRRPCKPSLDTLVKMAAAYEIPVVEMLARAGVGLEGVATDTDEAELLSRYRRLSARARSRLWAYLDDLDGGASRAAER